MISLFLFWYHQVKVIAFIYGLGLNGLFVVKIVVLTSNNRWRYPERQLWRFVRPTIGDFVDLWTRDSRVGDSSL